MTHFWDMGKKMKERRTLLRITQQDLADVSGVGVRTIKDVETNKGNPSLDTLFKIFDALGMEMELRIKK